MYTHGGTYAYWYLQDATMLMYIVVIYALVKNAGRLCPKEGQVKVASAIVQLHYLPRVAVTSLVTLQ